MAEEKCCCSSHSHNSQGCCGGGMKKGDMSVGEKLVVSAISLVLSFCISVFDIKFPFFPYSDPAWIAVFFCAGGILKSAFRSLFFDKKINVAMLVSIAMIASFILQVMSVLGYNVGEHSHSYIFVIGEIAFLICLGEWLENRTIAKTKAGLKKLSELMPKVARVRRGSTMVEISASEICIGDIVCVNPNEMISADGVVVKGESSVNQANMTGESMPVDVKQGDSVLCGTYNENSYIEIRAEKTGASSVLAKMIELVAEAEGTRAPIAQIAAKWATYIVPVAVSIAVATFLFSYFFLSVSVPEAVVRATTILVVFCPCAFVLATPTAISAGIGNAAKNGVLIKSGDVLEEFSKITTVFFDKTGTLTQGKVSVVEFEVAETKSKAEILAKVVAVEKHSAHPFACAIVDFGMSQGIEVLEATSVESVVGSGMKGFVGGVQIEIRKADLKDNNVASSVSEILENGDVVAKVYFSDKIRSQSKDAVARIKNLGCNVAMLSGDNYSVAKNVGQECGIENVYARLLPQEKLEIIRSAKADGNFVCMVGDGVNDAPSLAEANTSVAIADLKNDIAINTARVSLLDGDIRKISALILFSKQVLSTITTNIIFSLSISGLAVVLGAFGIISPAIGALIHNFSSVSVVANSARLLNSKTLKKD